MDNDMRFVRNSDFTLMEDPLIFEWQNSLKEIEAHTEEFTVPGERLDSGKLLTRAANSYFAFTC